MEEEKEESKTNVVEENIKGERDLEKNAGWEPPVEDEEDKEMRVWDEELTKFVCDICSGKVTLDLVETTETWEKAVKMTAHDQKCPECGCLWSLNPVVNNTDSGVDVANKWERSQGAYLKEWLGGFVDKRTGRRYTHAQTTTPPFWKKRFKINKTVEVGCRKAGLVRHREVQNEVNKSTQTHCKGVFLDPRGDRYVAANPFLLYKEEFPKVVEATIIIQRWYRKCVKLNRIRDKFRELIRIINTQRMERKVTREALIDHRLKNFTAISFPVTKHNFFLIHWIVRQWWQEMTQSLSSLVMPEEKLAEAYWAFIKEIKVMYEIDTQMVKCRKENLKRKELKLLEESSKPIIRKLGKQTTLIDTLPSQRAREIKEIFVLYRSTKLTKKERIELLLILQNFILEFKDFEKANEAINLMNEEIQLLSIDIPEKFLTALRKRGEELFLQYVKNPKFNPSGANYRPISFPNVKKRAHRCLGCLKNKDQSNFPNHALLTYQTHCLSCEAKNVAPRNLAPYAYILQILRQNEVRKCPDNVICHIIQPYGIQYIVNTIWNGHSAVSEASFPYELRLVRWNREKDWSPWNCIVMTEEEAEVHERIADVYNVYEKEFIQAVTLKQINAKIKFKNILLTQKFVFESGMFESTVEERSHIHPFRRMEVLEPEDPFFKTPIKDKDIYCGKVNKKSIKIKI